MGKRTWTKQQLAKLIKEYPTKATRLLSEELGKNYSAVKSKATVLKLKKEVYSSSPFTPEKLEYLISNYSNTRNIDLADKLGVSEGSVSAKAFKLGLKKSEEFMRKCSSKGYFKKGHIPKNKGKKQSEFMSPEAIEKTKATRFQNGHLPHNTKYDGHERVNVDGYIEVRVSLGVYKLKHRIIWEEEHGSIPDAHCIAFKDGNPLNCEIHNLEIISQTENMYRNSRHGFPKEIIPSMVLTKKIDNKLKTLKDG